MFNLIMLMTYIVTFTKITAVLIYSFKTEKNKHFPYTKYNFGKDDIMCYLICLIH